MDSDLLINEGRDKNKQSYPFVLRLIKAVALKDDSLVYYAWN